MRTRKALVTRDTRPITSVSFFHLKTISSILLESRLKSTRIAISRSIIRSIGGHWYIVFGEVLNVALIVLHVVVDSALILKSEKKRRRATWKWEIKRSDDLCTKRIMGLSERVVLYRDKGCNVQTCRLCSPPRTIWTLAWARGTRCCAVSNRPYPCPAVPSPNCLDPVDVFASALAELEVLAMGPEVTFREHWSVDNRTLPSSVSSGP